MKRLFAEINFSLLSAVGTGDANYVNNVVAAVLDPNSILVFEESRLRIGQVPFAHNPCRCLSCF